MLPSVSSDAGEFSSSEFLRIAAGPPPASRVGESFQAQIPECIKNAEEELINTAEDFSIAGAPIWLPSRARLPARSLEVYLSFVASLFASPSEFSEERALFFLHLCDYSIPTAQRLLKPAQPPASPQEEIDATQADLYPADDFCSLCSDGGDLILCENKDCRKVFHPACVGLEAIPEGKWICPYHACKTCQAAVEREPRQFSSRLQAFLGLEGNAKKIHQQFPVPAYPACGHCPTAWCPEHWSRENYTKNLDYRFMEFLCSACLEKELTDSYDKAGNFSARRAFFKRLQHCMKREGKQLVKIPILGRRELDLMAFYRGVIDRGGINVIIHSKGWWKVARSLNFSRIDENLLKNLKQYYLLLFYGYEKQYYRGFQAISEAAAASYSDCSLEEDFEEEIIKGKKAGKNSGKNARHEEFYDRDDEPEDAVIFIGRNSSSQPAKPNQKEKNAAKPERARTMTAKPVAKKRGRGRPPTSSKTIVAEKEKEKTATPVNTEPPKPRVRGAVSKRARLEQEQEERDQQDAVDGQAGVQNSPSRVEVEESTNAPAQEDSLDVPMDSV